MERLFSIQRHGVTAILQPVSPQRWRIFIAEGQGAVLDHAGTRRSAEARAGWECWCHKRRR